MRIFVDKGLAAAEASRVAVVPEMGGLSDLPKFRQGGPWDIQRVGPKAENQPAFIDASNVAIGLYAAAAGMPLPIILKIADHYAAGESKFGGTERDADYPSLRKENVYDISLGHQLYQSGRIGPTKAE